MQCEACLPESSIHACRCDLATYRAKTRKQKEASASICVSCMVMHGLVRRVSYCAVSSLSPCNKRGIYVWVSLVSCVSLPMAGVCQHVCSRPTLPDVCAADVQPASLIQAPQRVTANLLPALTESCNHASPRHTARGPECMFAPPGGTILARSRGKKPQSHTVARLPCST